MYLQGILERSSSCSMARVAKKSTSRNITARDVNASCLIKYALYMEWNLLSCWMLQVSLPVWVLQAVMVLLLIRVVNLLARYPAEQDLNNR